MGEYMRMLTPVGPTDFPLVPPGWAPAPGVPASEWPKPEAIDARFACTVCGVATPLEGAGHMSIDRGWRKAYPPGRFCSVCRVIASNSVRPVLIVEGLVDPGDPAAEAVFRSLRWFCDLGSWTHPWHAGWRERWAHVDRAVVADIVDEVHRGLAPHPSPFGTGCAACGVSMSDTWTGQFPGRTGGWHALCHGCGDLVGARGSVSEWWNDDIAAAAVGLMGPPMPGFAASVRFRPFWDVSPQKPGTVERFGYLGADRDRLREAAARRYPEFVPAVGLSVVAVAQGVDVGGPA